MPAKLCSLIGCIDLTAGATLEAPFIAVAFTGCRIGTEKDWTRGGRTLAGTADAGFLGNAADKAGAADPLALHVENTTLLGSDACCVATGAAAANETALGNGCDTVKCRPSFALQDSIPAKLGLLGNCLEQALAEENDVLAWVADACTTEGTTCLCTGTILRTRRSWACGCTGGSTPCNGTCP